MPSRARSLACQDAHGIGAGGHFRNRGGSVGDVLDAESFAPQASLDDVGDRLIRFREQDGSG